MFPGDFIWGNYIESNTASSFFMITKTAGSVRRKIIKFSIALFILLLVAFGGGYFWFVHNSKQILIDLVNERSQGRLKLQLAEATFNFTKNEVRIREAKIMSTRKNAAPILYDIGFRRIILHTNSIWSLLINRSLEIREIEVFDPVIDAYNNAQNSSGRVNQLSIGAELGKIYNSIQDGIAALHTDAISVVNAKLILNNDTSSGRKPIVFSNIYFTLKKLDKFNDEPGKYFQNNNLDFRSSNQDIVLSDGVHRLTFKELTIKDARSIILDTCTIIALPTLASGNNYNISFKKLALIGVDFNALYRKGIIRADSVYCEYPNSRINLNSNVVDSNIASRGIPDIEKIIRSLSGNLDFGFIGVMNADIQLDIKGKKTLSNFHSGRVNFQINNLRINPDSSKLVSIGNFDMMVNGYRLYNADSTSVFSFDSIRFSNDKLLLNNFSVHTISGDTTIRNYRNYNAPFFELLGIDWSELIFNQNLTATAAILHDPVINFRKNKKVEITKNSIFSNSHHSLGDFMDIDKLKIINGTVNIYWGTNNFLQLTGLALNALGDNITDYKHVSLNRDIESLFFTNGSLQLGDINARLRNVVFNANDQVFADEIVVNNNKGGFDSRISKVSIDKITADKNNGTFKVDGLKWDNGTVRVKTSQGTKQKHRPSSIVLNNVDGKHTRFEIIKKPTKASAFINHVQIEYFLKNNDRPFVIKGLSLQGESLSFADSLLQTQATAFTLSDTDQQFQNIIFNQNNNGGNFVVSAPLVRLNGEFNSYFGNDLHFKDVTLESPEINYNNPNTVDSVARKRKQQSPIKIDHIDIHAPVINIMNSSSADKFSLPHSDKSDISINGFQLDSNRIAASNLSLQTNKAGLDRGGEKILAVDGAINISLKKISFSNTGKQPDWEMFVDKLVLKNGQSFTFKLKDDTLRFSDVNVGNMQLNNALLNSPLQLLKANPDASVSSSSVTYHTKNSLWNADNVSYNGSKKTLATDSIHYHPRLSSDSVIAASKYQTDYIWFTSGKSQFSGFDINDLFNDNSLLVEHASFMHPYIHVYRDKLPPFHKGVEKKLFTDQIKNIEKQVTVDNISINDGGVSYVEKNAKTRLDGDFNLTDLNGTISNVKNQGLKAVDSLSITMRGRLLGKAPFDLALKQSYVDSLSGFIMDLQLEPTQLYILNPLLAPLANVKFISGYLNDLEMHATGNKKFAYGKMKFYYHDLHIKLLKNGGRDKTRLLKSTESNLVNFFFLKNNNTSRIGRIYFERLEDRSFFNYMTKIIFSGLSTSVGARKNRSYLKRYKQNNISTAK